MSNISLITSNNNNDIFIISDGINSKLAYYNEDGELIILKEGSSRFRPIHCSELNKILKDRGWNLLGTKYVSRVNFTPTLDNFDIWSKSSKSTAEIPPINTAATSTGYASTSLSISSSVESQINEEFKTIFGEEMNATNEIDFYSSSWNIMDFLDSSIMIDLIKYNSDTYTNTLSIGNLIQYSSTPGVTGNVNLSVQYSKEGNIWAKDINFQAFRYELNSESGNTELKTNKVTEIIEDEVRVEFMDGIIQVIPVSDNVDECIIRNCTITYGNI